MLASFYALPSLHALLFAATLSAVKTQMLEHPRSLLVSFEKRAHELAAAAAGALDENHRHLQISFDIFVEVICQPFAQSLVEDGVDPDFFPCDCFSEAEGRPPFSLQCASAPVCLSGRDLVEFLGEACPGTICTSIHLNEEWSDSLVPLKSESEFRFSGATDYEALGRVISVLDDGRDSVYVRLAGRKYECTKPITFCPALTEDEDEIITQKFDCSNLQAGWKEDTCPGGSYFDSFNICPIGGAKVPGSFVPCFSSESAVDVQDRGPTKMKDLQLGDLVQVEGGNYEPIYSFGHKNNDDYSEFLAISTTDNTVLEISKDHMVGRPNGNFAPARLLRVGDSLVASSGGTVIVRSIRAIQRKGVYAPFTKSGTIIVNGILASTYIAYDDSEYLRIGSMETPFTYQWLAHTFQSLHRLANKLNLAGEETYSKEGVSHWVHGPHKFAVWLLDQHVLIVLPVMTVAMLFFGSVSAVEVAPASLVAAILLANFIRVRMLAPSPKTKRGHGASSN